MSDIPILFDLSELPADGPIYVYGANRFGAELFRDLAERMPDRVAALVDSFQTGSVAGRPITSPAELKATAPAGALVLVTCRDVAGVRAGLGPDPRFRVFDANTVLKKDATLRDLEAMVQDLNAWKEDYLSWSRRELGTRDAWVEMNVWRVRALQRECFGPPAPVACPPRTIPEPLLAGFSMAGRVPIAYSYEDSTYPGNYPMIYTDGEVDAYLARIAAGEHFYYGETDASLGQAFDRHPVAGQTVAVLGSRTPWYEAFCLSRGARPITIDYNPILVRCDRLEAHTLREWQAHPRKVDSVLCVSSVEHSGLGRYGDPLDPDADLKAMAELRAMLEPGGILYLTTPVGPDQVLFNLHRIYGPCRLPRLLEGWEQLGVVGWDGRFTLPVGPEPVFILRRP